MDATSIRFLLFALIVGLAYNLRRTVAWRQSVLLVANLVFLASFAGNWKGYLPLALFVITGYCAILLMKRPGLRGWFVPGIITFVLLFAWLKRYSFIPHTLYLPMPYLALGLSYIFFRIMHMIIDAKDEMLPDSVGLVPYLNYTLNFTTMVSGPIQLYPDFAATQLAREQRSLTIERCAQGLERVVIGFFKLRILSAVFSGVHHEAITELLGGHPDLGRTGTACVVLAAYPLYLYFNFSGFMDVMIGVGTLFHLDLPENFNRAFSSASFIEFWGRWHITLSSWLKAYVYTPLVRVLMGKFPSVRIEPFLGVVGFFVTFFLVGVWHGQTSEFLFFGFLVGGGVALNKLFQVTMSNFLGRKRYNELRENVAYKAFARGLTFTYFAFSLLWFWSSWTQLRQFDSALTLRQLCGALLATWVGSTVLLSAWERLHRFALDLTWEGNNVLRSVPLRAAWVVYLLIVTVVALSSVNVATPVLYQVF